ncbi:MAG: hypothetical protein U9P50_03010 [Patescibacteria group bacterium]|nr:hypothetical protein [Patescibacteria group bacterium]
MSRLKNRNKVNKIVYSWLVLVVLVVVIVLVGKGVWGVYKSKEISFNNRMYSEEEYERLKGRSDSVTIEIEMLETEKGVETEIRDKFRVVKEGEQLAVIINSVEDDKKVEVEKEKKSFFKKIWEFLRD